MRSASRPKTLRLVAAAFVAAAAVAAVNRTPLPAHPSVPLEPSGAVAPKRMAAETVAALPTVDTETAKPLERRLSPGTAAPRAPRRLRPRAAAIGGRAIDLEGRALVGVEVHLASDRERSGRTDATGRFEVSTSRGHDLFCVAPASGFLAIGSSRAGSPGAALVVAARSSAPLHLEITDASTGRPLSHAKASIDVTPWLKAVETRHAALHPLALRSTSDATGHAFLASVPDLPGLTVSVEREGYRTRSVALDGDTALGLSVALERFHAEEELRGRVLSQMGEGVSGAEVTAGGRLARSRADGSFALRLPSDPDAEAAPMLFAYHPAHGTARLSTGASAKIELVLEPRPSAPERALRFESGEPLASVRVVPVGANGAPDPLAPHWHCARSNAAGEIPLGVIPSDGGRTARVAITKDGTALGRVELEPSGEAWVVIRD